MDSPKFEDYVRQPEERATSEERQLLAELRTHFAKRHAEQFVLGRQLAAARRQRNLSQEDLARLSGVNQPEISRIERGQGNPTCATLRRLGESVGAYLAFVTPSGKVVDAQD
jgi:XRE family transcriptional regulator, regulator of sulfur utilization